MMSCLPVVVSCFTVRKLLIQHVHVDVPPAWLLMSPCQGAFYLLLLQCQNNAERCQRW